jgi:hypothetical protein
MNTESNSGPSADAGCAVAITAEATMAMTAEMTGIRIAAQ